MKKTEKLNKTRQRMIDEYVKCLKEDKIPWRCGWNQLIAISGSSKKPYRGVNQMLLSYIASEKGYTDRRWYTMGNIKENGWHLKKGSESYYIPSQDKIVLPKKELFNSQLAYDATKLHEMCHATGHPTRLNRPIQNSFGSKEYAKEELRAEIGSSFLVQELGLGSTDAIQDMGNHKAYIQSWIEVLENNPNELFRAVKDAEKITEYVKEKAELQKAKNIDKEQERSKDSKVQDADKNKISSYHENINPKNLKINKEKEMQKEEGINK